MHFAVTVMANQHENNKICLGDLRSKLMWYVFKVLYIREKDMKTRSKRQSDIKYICRVENRRYAYAKLNKIE